MKGSRRSIHSFYTKGANGNCKVAIPGKYSFNFKHKNNCICVVCLDKVNCNSPSQYHKLSRLFEIAYNAPVNTEHREQEIENFLFRAEGKLGSYIIKNRGI